MAFKHIGFSLRWEGAGVDEVGILAAIDEEKYELSTSHSITPPIFKLLNSILIKIDPRYFRPTEVELLVGDPTKSNTKLGWNPEYDLEALVEDMMLSDIKIFQKDLHLSEYGHHILRQAE
jgi:GDPmannose 4,6-dehydratase